MTAPPAATDREAFVRRIVENPADDAPRLIYADWLDERGGPGDAERAEFVRCQIELARTRLPDREACAEGCDQRNLNPCRVCLPCYRLAWRERALWDAGAIDWFDPRSMGLSTIRLSSANIGYVLPAGFVSRGFVAEVRTDTATFLGAECRACGGRGWEGTGRAVDIDRSPDCPACGGSGTLPALADTLAARVPLERVVLVGKEPAPAGPVGEEAFRYAWTNCDPPTAAYHLPSPLFDAMPTRKGDLAWIKYFPSRDAALAALSAAAVSLCRRRAGLEQPT